MLTNKIFQALIMALLLSLLPQAQAEDFTLTATKPTNGTIISSPAGINCGDDCSASYLSGTEVEITATPKTGFKFTSWTGDCASTSNPTFVIMDNGKTCSANFDEQVFGLSIAKNEHGKVTSTPPGIDCGDDCTEQYKGGTFITITLNTEPDEGYKFSNWGGSCGDSTAPSITITIDAAKTCTAFFKLLPYELKVQKIGTGTGTVSSNVFGIECGETCNAPYDGGTEVILTAQPGADSKFASWAGDCKAENVDSSSITVTMNQDIDDCTAEFKLLPHNLNVATNGEGTVISKPIGIDCGEICVKSYDHAEEVTLTAVPKTGFKFVEWIGDCTDTETPFTATVTMDTAKSCTASFKHLPVEITLTQPNNGTVTVTSTLEEINCGSKCTASYEYGTAIKLTAVPDAEYDFIGWHGDCKGIENPTDNIDLFTAKNCSAHFAHEPPEGRYNLSVVTVGAGDGNVTSEPEGIDCKDVCTKLYDDGITVMLTATALGGSEFEYWGGDCSGSTNPFFITLAKNSICTAKFKPQRSTYYLNVKKSGDGFGTIKSENIPGIDCGTDCENQYPDGSTVILTAYPINSKTNWIGNCSGDENTVSVSMNKAKTCIAEFQPLPTHNLTVAYSGNGNGIIISNVVGKENIAEDSIINCGDNCTKYPANAAIELTAAPKTDSIFNGWDGGDCTGTESPITITIDRDKTCTANFTQKPAYELTVIKTENSDGYGTLERSPTGVNCGEGCMRHPENTEVILTATTPKEDSTFEGWGEDCSGTESPLAVKIDAVKVCTAEFKQKPIYTLTVTKTGNGTVSCAPEGINGKKDCITMYYGDDSVIITAEPVTGNKFSDWSGDCTDTEESTTVTINAATNCTANFEQLPPAKLTVTKSGNGTGTVTAMAGVGAGINCGNVCSADYLIGAEVTLTATATDADSMFAGWSGDCSGTSESTAVTLDAAKTCEASFELLAPPGRHNLFITKQENGTVTSESNDTEATEINCGAACTTHYAKGIVATLIAVPNDDFTFTGWSGDCDSTSTKIVVEMNGPQICMAHFAQIPAAGQQYFTIVKTGNGTVTSVPAGINCGTECAKTFPAGTNVTLTANSEPLSRFASWGCGGGKDVQTTIKVDTTKICTAEFKLIPSSLQFSITDYLANEIGSTRLIVTRAATDAGAVSVDYTTTTDGTAQSGSDYESVSGTLTWADGDMTRKEEIIIPILPDTLEEGDETIIVTLSNVMGPAELGTNAQATLTIIDMPPNGAGLLQFSALNYAADETSGAATLSVERIGGNVGTVSVSYATSDDTAVAGDDYTTSKGVLSWKNGDTQTKNFSVPIFADTDSESEETLTLSLSNPTGRAVLGANQIATLQIVDSFGTPVSGKPGILQFSNSNYPATEGDGSVTLTVNRVQGGKGEVNVDYTTQDGTAKAGSDYTTTSGVLNWGNDDITSKDITVPIQADTVEEDSETFTVSLANLRGDASLGTIPSATVKIADELATPVTPIPPSPGIIQFSEADYQIAENSGSITITVTRTGGSLGVVEVTYITQDETASNRDYIATNGTFRWLNGESHAQTFQVKIYDDGLIEDGDEKVLLKLSNPTGGVQLGDNVDAILTIVDDDATSIRFSANTYLADEDSDSATITAIREGGKIDNIMVEYETIDDCQPSTDNCATAGEDYAAVRGFLMWLSGKTGEQTFTIPIFDDKEEEGNETLQLRLFNLDGDATFGTREATLTIVDNDQGDCELEAVDPIIDCFWNNNGKTLQGNIEITERGTITGGELGGNIENEGVVQNVSLLANSQLSGIVRGIVSSETELSGGIITVYGSGNEPNTLYINGVVRGNITSDPKAPATITNLKITADSTLSNIIIGNGVMIETGASLKEGVLFKYNGLIPYMADLNELLGTISAPALEMDAINITNDVLVNRNINGILSTINGLYEFASLNRVIKQNPDNGYMMLDIDSNRYTALPVSVQQIWGSVANQALEPVGFTLHPNGEVAFVTLTGRKVIALPVVQEPQILRDALSNVFGLHQMTMQENGNLKVPADGGNYYMARPNLFSTTITDEIPLGISSINSNRLINVMEISLVFTDSSANVRRQLMYPAAANPEALYALSTEDDCQLRFHTELHNDGRVYAYTGSGEQKKNYRGLLDYSVTPGQPSGKAQFRDTSDINQDGEPDYLIIYPNGDTQVMYRCFDCFGTIAPAEEIECNN